MTPCSLSRQVFLTAALSFCLYFCLFLFPPAAYAATIGRIDIEGLHSIDREEMLDMLGLKEGALLDAGIIRAAIKRAFRKGIFDDISIEASDSAPSVVTVQVREKDMISRIVIQGNYPLSARRVRELLLLKEGEVMRQELVVQAAAELKNSFAELGFPEAVIDISYSPDQKRHHNINLVIAVETGAPLVIKGVRIKGTELVRADDIGLSVNDVYDQVRLRKGLQRLRERLKKEGYLKPLTGPYSFQEGILVIQIDPGKRLETVVDGNAAITTRRLEKEMPFFDAEVFNNEAVDEAVNRMLALYHSEGYSHAQIAPVVMSDQQQYQVTFFVYEGRQTRIRSIRFAGASLSPEILQSALELKVGGPYNPDLKRRDRDTLGEYYAALGYLEASAGEFEVRLDEASGQADLIIPISEGMLTTIGSIEIKGVNQDKREQLLSLIPLREGQPYNDVEISDARFRIIDHYARDGYAAIDVVIQRTIEQYSARLVFAVAEGRRITIGKTIIAGNERTKYRVLKREIAHDEDSPYSFNILGQERQKLYKLGLFTEVDIEAFDAGDDRRDLLVRVREGNAGAFEFGFGYAEYERFRSFFEIGYRNLFGMNRLGQFRAELSSLERRLIFQYHEPWALGSALPLRTVFLYEQKKELTIPGRVVRYELERYALNVGVEKKLTDRLKGELYYEYSLVGTTNVQPDVILSREDVGTLSISSVRLALLYDSRDNPFEPKKGIFAGVAVKIASPVLFSEAHFMKMTVFAGYFKQLHKRLVLGLSARGGFAFGLGETTELPIVERFFLGGRSSVRGYAQDALGPKGSDGNPTGGNAFAMGNVELRTDIGKGISLVSFLDFGSVWINTRDFSLNDMQYTAGLGLRYATPVGPLRVDYGYKLKRADICVDRPFPSPPQCSPESRGVIHFSIGHAF